QLPIEIDVEPALVIERVRRWLCHLGHAQIGRADPALVADAVGALARLEHRDDGARREAVDHLPARRARVHGDRPPAERGLAEREPERQRPAGVLAEPNAAPGGRLELAHRLGGDVLVATDPPVGHAPGDRFPLAPHLDGAVEHARWRRAQPRLRVRGDALGDGPGEHARDDAAATDARQLDAPRRALARLEVALADPAARRDLDPARVAARPL